MSNPLEEQPLCNCCGQPESAHEREPRLISDEEILDAIAELTDQLGKYPGRDRVKNAVPGIGSGRVTRLLKEYMLAATPESLELPSTIEDRSAFRACLDHIDDLSAAERGALRVLLADRDRAQEATR